VNEKGEIHYLDCNPAHQELTGMSPEWLHGKTPKQLVPEISEETASFIEAKYRSCLESGSNLEYEQTIQLKGKDIRWLTKLTPFKDESDKIYRIIGANIDITEMKNLQNEKMKNEKLQERAALIDSLSDGIAVLDLQGVHQMVNPAFIELTQLSSSELLGKSSQEIIKKLIVPEDQKQVNEKLKKLLGGKKVKPIFFKMRAKDGQEKSISFSVNFIYDGQGNPKNIVGSFRDISEMVKARELQLEIEERINLATNAADIGIWNWDLLTNVTYYSDVWKAQLGYAPDELENSFSVWEELLHPDDYDRMNEELQNYIQNPEEFFHAEFRLRHKDGSYRWIRNQSSSDINAKGEIIKMLGVHIDITQRKEFENQLNWHQQHIKLINKILRHDLTNNLAAIRAHLNIFDRDNDKGNLEGIGNYVEKSVQLIRRMKDLEIFLESNKELKIYKLQEVITQIKSKYDEVIFKVYGNCNILADQAIYSVFDNIFGNAVKHGKTDKIDIDVTKQNDMCKVTIADYGKGIPDELKSKIFEENFIYGEEGGSGLGLYIVKNIVERYGGTVFVKDNEPHGTKVTFFLRLI